MTRSDASLDESRLYVTHQNRLHEYTTSGTLVKTYDVPYPTGSRPLSENARDLVMTPEGRLALYHGTFSPYLSWFDPAAEHWKHATADGWTTANNLSYGGIAAHGHNVFVTDMDTTSAPAVSASDANSSR